MGLGPWLLYIGTVIFSEKQSGPRRRPTKEMSMRPPARDLSKFFILTGILALLLSGFALAADDEAPTEKIKINSLDELPVHTYPLDISVTELLEKPKRMRELRKQFRADNQK